MTELGLKNETVAAIQKVLALFPCVERAVVFGSRAKGTYKDYSDVDISLCGDLDAIKAEEISCALDELPLVYKFDVIAYNSIENKALREHIERVGVEIYKKVN